jgi:hypothetical protein
MPMSRASTVVPHPSSVQSPRRPRLLDLMAIVATFGLLFGAHHSLGVALGEGPLAHLPRIATGIIITVALGHALLTSLRRRHLWRGIDTSRDFLIALLLAFGLPAAVFSGLASIPAGVMYLAATLVILVFSMRH